MRRSCALFLALALPLAATTFRSEDVKILGDIDYGQTNGPTECSGTQQYCALIFNGVSGDKVEITVTAPGSHPFIALADGTLNQLATGTGRLSFKLPNVGPDPQAYYIVFRDPEGKATKFTVELKKIQPQSAARRPIQTLLQTD